MDLFHGYLHVYTICIFVVDEGMLRRMQHACVYQIPQEVAHQAYHNLFNKPMQPILGRLAYFLPFAPCLEDTDRAPSDARPEPRVRPSRMRGSLASFRALAHTWRNRVANGARVKRTTNGARVSRVKSNIFWTIQQDF